MTNTKTTFFVATDGNDNWSGTLASPNADKTDGPFATLTRARDAVRKLKYAEGLQQPVEIQVRGGTYYLSEPLRLSAGDSGTTHFPITYTAYPGEKPILSGGDAIRLQNKNTRSRIVGNEIAYSGAYGIFLGSFQRGFSRHDTMSGDAPSPTEWYSYPEDRDVTVKAWPKSTHHLISNNHIHHVGVFEKHACGIAIAGISSIDNVLSHNLIHHTPRFGIGMMSGFGRVIIEYNELHHLSLETCDTGGITSNRWYTYEKDPDLCRGNIIRFNYIHDVIGCGAYDKKWEPEAGTKAGGRISVPYYGWAIYFDNGPMNVLVYGNITARNMLGGIMISHYCKNVTVENNIFVDSDQSQSYLNFGGKMENMMFRKNICIRFVFSSD